MPGTFFRALNPNSEQAGLNRIDYKGRGICSITKEEIRDVTVLEVIKQAMIRNDLNFTEGLVETFNIIYGRHYEKSVLEFHNDSFVIKASAGNGQKGILDFLIFPLFSRALNHCSCATDKSTDFPTLYIAFIITLPLEIARFSAAMALSLLLSPVVAVVHCIRDSGLIENNQKNIMVC